MEPFWENPTAVSPKAGLLAISVFVPFMNSGFSRPNRAVISRVISWGLHNIYLTIVVWAGIGDRVILWDGPDNPGMVFIALSVFAHQLCCSFLFVQAGEGA